jgi:hypothetical protein
MSDVQDLYHTLLVIDSVYDPIVCYSDRPFFPTFESCATRRARVFGERKNRAVYPLVDPVG